MTDSLTQMLERAAGPVPPAPEVSQLVDAGRRRRRRRVVTAMTASLAVLAVVGGGIAILWPSPTGTEILDQPAVVYEPYQGQEVDASVFLCNGDRCPAITVDQLSDLHAEFAADPVVEAVYFESQETAYERFVERLADQPELVESVSPGPLPASFRLKLTNPELFDVIQERFGTFPGVEAIVDQYAAEATEPAPDAETVDAPIEMVEVAPDGRVIVIYTTACEQQGFLVEFEEAPSEVRVRVVRTTDQDPTGCQSFWRRNLEEPLEGRPIIDLSTGDPVDNVTDLPSPAP